jgi:hypothetical protein
MGTGEGIEGSVVGWRWRHLGQGFVMLSSSDLFGGVGGETEVGAGRDF